MIRAHRIIVLALACAVAACSQATARGANAPATSASPSARASGERTIAPSTGHLMVVGGGQIAPAIVSRFIELAGGPDAPIVVIPTAGEDSVYPTDWSGLGMFTRAGARNLTIIHTRDRRLAESDSFATLLRRARGVWFPGGRQWRLVDAYLGTRSERELHALLARGGVVGGTSAGASILASYLVRGAREGNTIMMAPGYEQGFGFLRDVAVDQHVGARKRERDLQQVIAAHPALLGLGLDEGTAIVVRGDRAEVMGPGLLYVHNGGESPGTEQPYVTLRAGETLDLRARRRISAAQR
ncbi:MAG: cyanophycinase [Gemmatimonadetes bacterium]|nr:cyanophycinase [Gemmatimonadota bacterium]